ncbi:transposase [Paraburkholderia sp. MM6662-R1]
MRTDQTSTTGGEEPLLAVSLELAAAHWKIALHDGQREKPAVHTLAQPQAAARLQAALSLIERHKEKWSLPAGVRIVVSYEAGQDAFWICRALQAHGIECYVVDPVPRVKQDESSASIRMRVLALRQRWRA